MASQYTMEDAEKLVRKAIETSGIMISCGRFEEAEAILTQATKTGVDSYDALILLALVKNQRGMLAEAEELLLKAIELNPSLPSAYSDLSLCYGAMRQYEAALKYAQEAVNLKPNEFSLMNNLGLAYRSCGMLDQAAKVLEWCHQEAPDDPYLVLNLASVYSDRLELDLAESYLRGVIKKNPELNPAYINLAYIQMLRGEYEIGFLNYERRFKSYATMQWYVTNYGLKRMWDSRADLNGKKVIIYGEQGYGDTIMCSRYIPKLKSLYPDVSLTLACPLELARLFETGFGLDDIISRNSAVLPPFDYHIPTMSFPLLLQDYDCSTPCHHTVVEPCRIDSDNFKVGLCWKGSELNPGDRKRSIPLAKFFAISQIPGVDFYGLQFEHNDHAAVKSLGITNLMDGVVDFHDTARLIASLDLVLTVDTSVLHLAGLVGVESWGLIPTKPDWRWGLNSDTARWYPKMKLFRQHNRGDWDNTLDHVYTELVKKIEASKTSN